MGRLNNRVQIHYPLKERLDTFALFPVKLWTILPTTTNFQPSLKVFPLTYKPLSKILHVYFDNLNL